MELIPPDFENGCDVTYSIYMHASIWTVSIEGFHVTSSPRIITASAMLDFFPLSFYVLYYTEKYPTWPPGSS